MTSNLIELRDFEGTILEAHKKMKESPLILAVQVVMLQASLME